MVPSLAARSTPASERSRALRAVWLGRVGYAEAGRRQKEAARRVAAGGEETLFLLEHTPVFTLGRNGSSADVLWSAERRRAEGVELHEADRGGKVTYHGPGQLVGYPVLNLSPDRRDVKRYVTDLEEVLIRALSALGISAARSPRKERVTSVWVGEDKIAAIGVHIARWITSHGFALNVTDEALGNFSGIVPCGIADGGVTSIQKVSGKSFSVEEIAGRLARPFCEVFGREIIAA
ncbi:MAG TPA: lipoyl(octanoyl) transferase LipB [Thermoanaerobaculia bacterium]|nr:lipoyl(octanoyl) transferase LipB [Thermoanaerobaculia bacterium]